MNRVIKGATYGAAIGVDDLGRYLSPDQRQSLITRLTGDVEARATRLVADARARAATIICEAEAAADAVRRQAYQEGYEEGRRAGHDEAHAQRMAEMAAWATTLKTAAEEAEQVRLLLLRGAESEAVAVAMDAARRIVGAAADAHAGLAATTVRTGIRATAGRIVRIHVNPADVVPVKAALLDAGRDLPLADDSSVEVGGCLIDVEGGTVDLRLPVQLDSIERMLLDS